MKCDKCGHTVPNDSEFCQYCGIKITVHEETCGKFGLDENNPILFSGTNFEMEYLSDLRSQNGQIINWVYEKNKFVPSQNAIIDMYRGADSFGNQYGPIFVNRYASTTTTQPADGFMLTEKVRNTYPPAMPVGAGNLNRIAYTPTNTPPKTGSTFRTGKTGGAKKASAVLALLLIVPLISIIVCLNIKSKYTQTELFYFLSILLCILSGVLLLMNVSLGRLSHILSPAAALTLAGAAVPLLFNPWYDGFANMKVGCFLLIAIISLFSMAIATAVLSLLTNIAFYRRSTAYRMKCYEKIEKINSLAEKGIITKDEFETARKQITAKIEK